MRFIFNIFFLFPIIGFGQAAFISGIDTICDDGSTADVEVSFSLGQPPYTFVYAINGINQTSITTNVNPYTFPTQQEGLYTLTYFSDSDTIGNIIGSALVTVLASPIALFTASPDTLSVLYTTTHLIDMSLGNIVNWIWDFGDNTTNDYSPNPYHTYPQWPPTVYQVTLIVLDNMGCSDTAFSTITVGQPTTSIQEHAINKEHLKVTDLLGRETKGTKNEVLFYIYDDGTVEKRIIIK
jgi:PKD repeat protein